MKQNSNLYKFSFSIIILSFIYLGLQINTLLYNMKFWIKYNSKVELLFGISREICEILYIPLWGIVIAFSMLFFDYWIKDIKNNNE